MLVIEHVAGILEHAGIEIFFGLSHDHGFAKRFAFFAFSFGHIVHDFHEDVGAGGFVVDIRNGHGEHVADAVLALHALMLEGVIRQIELEFEHAAAAVGIEGEAGDGEHAFVGGYLKSVGEGFAGNDGHAVDGDALHAVASGDEHRAGIGDGFIAFAGVAALQSGLVYDEMLDHQAGGHGVAVFIIGRNVGSVGGSAGNDAHGPVDVVGAAFVVIVGGRILPAHIEAAKAVDAVQQFHVGPGAVAGAVGRLLGRTGGRHEVGLVHGREEVFAGDLRAFHAEGRHLLAGIGGVEAGKRDGGAVFEGEHEIVAGAGKGSIFRREAENEAGIRDTADALGHCGLVQKYVGHKKILSRQ